MTELPLASALRHAVLSIWPRRSQQEALLDLGWRKAWTEADRDAALIACANWMSHELDLRAPHSIPRQPETQVPDDAVIAHLRDLAGSSQAVESVPGVAKWLAVVAPAVGTGAKALANSLTDGLRSDRRDHRWLRAIGRVLSGAGAPHAWAYHHRSAEAVAVELARAGSSANHDTGDAVLLLSLLALWQRRRPTELARGNKRRQSTRRSAPKPIAALAGSLVEPPQLQPLFELCNLIPQNAARTLATLVVEAALTEAHMAPHADRKRQRATGHASGSGEPWLLPVERWLTGAGCSLPAIDQAVVAFRIATMRAWRDQSPPPRPDATAVRSPYVAASMALSQAHGGDVVDLHQFNLAQPGLLMLSRLIRSACAKATK